MKFLPIAIVALSATQALAEEGHFLVTGTDPIGHAYSVEMTMIENGSANLLRFHYEEPIIATAVGDDVLSIATVYDGHPAASLMRRSEDGTWSGEWSYGNSAETGIETWTPIPKGKKDMVLRMRIENDFGDLEGLISLIAGLPVAGSEGVDAWVRDFTSPPFRIGEDYVEETEIKRISSAYNLVAPTEKIGIEDLSIMGNEVVFSDGKIHFIRSCAKNDCDQMAWSVSAMNPLNKN